MYLVIFLSGILLYDGVFTLMMLLNLKKFVEEFNARSANFSFSYFKDKYSRHSRLMQGFPDLRDELGRRFSSISKSIITEKNEILSIIDVIRNKNPLNDKEYLEIVNDILENPYFRQTDKYKHHSGSIFNHSVDVSYYSYLIAKRMNLDFVSTARGALFHDFFLYEWRKPHPEKGKNHGRKHPKTAYRNASKYFSVNDIEKDIILNHMWPFTSVFPETKEAIVVSLIDKHLASKELLREAKNKVKNYLSKMAKKQKLF